MRRVRSARIRSLDRSIDVARIWQQSKRKYWNIEKKFLWCANIRCVQRGDWWIDVINSTLAFTRVHRLRQFSIQSATVILTVTFFQLFTARNDSTFDGKEIKNLREHRWKIVYRMRDAKVMHAQTQKFGFWASTLAMPSMMSTSRHLGDASRRCTPHIAYQIGYHEKWHTKITFWRRNDAYADNDAPFCAHNFMKIPQKTHILTFTRKTRSSDAMRRTLQDR